MIERAAIIEIAEDCLARSGNYLIDVQVKSGNIILVVIDGDKDISIGDCAALHKCIETKLNRDVEDFELRVVSFGAEKPLKLVRQYKKNIGRDIEVQLLAGTTLTGTLIDADEKTVKVRVAGKKSGNTTPVTEQNIEFDQIKEAKILFSIKKH